MNIDIDLSELNNSYYLKYLKYKLKYYELSGGGGNIEAKHVVNKLYELIKTLKLCFSSGTFIIELTDNGVSKKLIDLYNTVAKQRPVQKTHNSFKDTEHHIKDKYDCISEQLCNRNYTITSEPQKEITIPETNVGCEKEVMRGCVLMYRFNLTMNNVTTKYMFVKIESDCVTGGLLSLLKHGFSALKIYIFKEKKTKCEFNTRREDHILDVKKCVGKNPELIRSKYIDTVSSRIKLDKELLTAYTSKQDFYNKHLRTGTELFLPSELLDKINLYETSV